MPEVEAISVTRLARRIRNLLEVDLGEIWVEGEVSNLRKQSSGHWYFSIKDEGAQISCAMFGARSRPGNEAIKDGAQVKIFGEVSFYEARGSTQLIVRKAQAAGVGDLQARFEALKRKLQSEGLFEASRKQKLPAFPQVVGLVTSPTGAALQDIKNVLSRRAPWLTVVLFPTSVQGNGAEKMIARAIRQANLASEGIPRPDVLIVGRGGGSLEDLWCFNEEVVARAIAASEIPVVSAVGHEIDFTIADFVADLRAPTPSAAAELVVPDQAELLERLRGQQRRISRLVSSRLDRLADQLDYLERGLSLQAFLRRIQEPLTRFDFLKRDFFRLVKSQIDQRERALDQERASWSRLQLKELLDQRTESLEKLRGVLRAAVDQQMARREQGVGKLESVLRALSPHNILERGYSLTFDHEGKLIRKADQLEVDQVVTTQFSEGKRQSRVL